MTRDAGGRGRSRGDTQAHSSPANVGVHAGLGDPKVTRDLFGRETAGDGAQDLTLAIGQCGDRVAFPREDSPGK